MTEANPAGGIIATAEHIGEAYYGIIALLGLVLMVLFGVIAIWQARKTAAPLSDMVHDRAKWGALIAELNSLPRPRYEAALTRLERFATSLFGERLFSVHAFARCLQIEFVLPFAAALLGWALFDAAAPGGLKIGESGLPCWQRGAATGGLVLAVLWLWYVSRNAAKIEARINQMLTPLLDRLDRRAGFLAKAARLSLPPIAFAFTGAGAVAGAGAGAGAVAVAVAGVVTVVVAAVVAPDSALIIFFSTSCCQSSTPWPISYHSPSPVGFCAASPVERRVGR